MRRIARHACPAGASGSCSPTRPSASGESSEIWPTLRAPASIPWETAPAPRPGQQAVWRRAGCFGTRIAALHFRGAVFGRFADKRGEGVR